MIVEHPLENRFDPRALQRIPKAGWIPEPAKSRRRPLRKMRQPLGAMVYPVARFGAGAKNRCVRVYLANLLNQSRILTLARSHDHQRVGARQSAPGFAQTAQRKHVAARK